MAENSNGNGTSKLQYWIMGVMVTVIVGGGGKWVSSISEKADAAQTEIAVLKATLPAIQEDLRDIKQQLREINRKLDSGRPSLSRPTSRFE